MTPQVYSVQEAAEVLHVSARRVRELIAAGLFPPAPCDSWRCTPKWCGYASRCPYAHGHKTI